MLMMKLLNLEGAILLIHLILKQKSLGQTGGDGTKDVEIMVPLKYLSNFWRTLEMPLINCEFNLILTWSSTCVLIPTNIPNQNSTFAITDTKLYFSCSDFINTRIY